MENNEMKKDKSKTIIIILLVIIIALLGSICIYLVLHQKELEPNNNNNNNNQQEQSNDEPTEENLTMTTTQQEYFMTEFIKKLDRTTLTSQPFEPDKFTNQEKLQVAFTIGELKEPTISYNTVLSTFQELFGNKISIDKTDYHCPFNQNGEYYNYNSSNDTYNYVPYSCSGGQPYISIVSRFEEGTIYEVDGEITSSTVKVRKSFSGVFSDIAHVSDELVRYGTFQNANNKTNVVDDFTSDYDGSNFGKFTDEYYIKGMEDNLEDYPIHTYTFGYENGSYYLQSLTIE